MGAGKGFQEAGHGRCRYGGEPQPETDMGKYLLAWLLGVPGIVLLLIYLFFH